MNELNLNKLFGQQGYHGLAGLGYQRTYIDEAGLFTLSNKPALDQTVIWVSQARGSYKVKEGIVRSIIKPNDETKWSNLLAQHGVTYWHNYHLSLTDVSKKVLKFQPTSNQYRVLIEVKRKHPKTQKESPSHWYAPKLSQFFWVKPESNTTL